MANEFVHASVGASLTQIEFEAVGLHVLNSQATGDLIYASSGTQLSRLGIGSTNKVLTVIGGVPTWQSTLAGLTLTNPTINACVLGGNMTVTGYAFDAGAGSAQINTTGGDVGLIVQSTQDGATGATAILKTISANPAASDVVGKLRTIGRNSVGTDREYMNMSVLITDPVEATLTSSLKWELYNSGEFNNVAMTLSGAGALWTDASVDTLSYKVGGVAGADFNGAVTNITVVKGIVTAAS
jgi:hypothetical protein